MTDSELMRAFVHGGNEGAFGEIVSRHAELVYSAAVRQVGSGAMAEDVTQSVFILLAKKAGRVESTLLAGWLVKAARFMAMLAARNERRRKTLEEKAAIMKSATDWRRSGHWERIESFLDEALGRWMLNSIAKRGRSRDWNCRFGSWIIKLLGRLNCRRKNDAGLMGSELT